MKNKTKLATSVDNAILNETSVAAGPWPSESEHAGPAANENRAPHSDNEALNAFRPDQNGIDPDHSAQHDSHDLSHDALALELGKQSWDQDAKYVNKMGKWFFWNEAFWRVDDRREHMTKTRVFLRKVARKLQARAKQKSLSVPADKAEKIRKLVRAKVEVLLNAPSIAAVESLEAEEKKAALEAELAALATASPTISVDAAAIYRSKIDALADTLSDPDIVHRASELLAGLIDRITVLFDPETGHSFQIEGKLMELLSFAQNKNAADFSAAAGSLKMVAGARFELATFRL